MNASKTRYVWTPEGMQAVEVPDACGSSPATPASECARCNALELERNELRARVAELEKHTSTLDGALEAVKPQPTVVPPAVDPSRSA